MPTAANIAKTAVVDLLHAHVIVMLDQARRIADITRLLVRILTPYTELQGTRNQNVLHGFEYELTVRAKLVDSTCTLVSPPSSIRLLYASFALSIFAAASLRASLRFTTIPKSKYLRRLFARNSS